MRTIPSNQLDMWDIAVTVTIWFQLINHDSQLKVFGMYS